MSSRHKSTQTQRDKNLSCIENFENQKTHSGTNALQTTRILNNRDAFHQVRDFVTSRSAVRAHITATEVAVFMQENGFISI